MSILVNENTKLVVQGITGKEGAFHTQQMATSSQVTRSAPQTMLTARASPSATASVARARAAARGSSAVETTICSARMEDRYWLR